MNLYNHKSVQQWIRNNQSINQSINQEWQQSPTTRVEALRSGSLRLIDWLIDEKVTLTWLVYWIRTAQSVFTGAGLKWPNTAGQCITHRCEEKLSLLQSFHTRQIIVTVMTCTWAVRLSAYLLLRAGSARERIDDNPASSDDQPEEVDPECTNNNPGPQHTVRFAIFWSLQAVWTFFVSFPVILVKIINTYRQKKSTDIHKS